MKIFLNVAGYILLRISIMSIALESFSPFRKGDFGVICYVSVAIHGTLRRVVGRAGIIGLPPERRATFKRPAGPSARSPKGLSALSGLPLQSLARETAAKVFSLLTGSALQDKKALAVRTSGVIIKRCLRQHCRPHKSAAYLSDPFNVFSLRDHSRKVSLRTSVLSFLIKTIYSAPTFETSAQYPDATASPD